MDFETTSPNGSQLLQQLKSTLTQYAPDYTEEAQQYEQAKDSLPDSTYSDALEAQFAAKLLYIAYQGFRWNLDCFQQPVNKLPITKISTRNSRFPTCRRSFGWKRFFTLPMKTFPQPNGKPQHKLGITMLIWKQLDSKSCITGGSCGEIHSIPK